MAGVAARHPAPKPPSWWPNRRSGLPRAWCANRGRASRRAHGERRRIERDLHDGAQQRLVALRIELELAQRRWCDDPALGAALRPRARRRRGARGAAGARARRLPAATGRSRPRRALRGRDAVFDPGCLRRGVARYPPEVESAVYFCVLEALQNVLKHATGAPGGRASTATRRSCGSASVTTAPGHPTARCGPERDSRTCATAWAIGGDVAVRSTPGAERLCAAAFPHRRNRKAGGSSPRRDRPCAAGMR